MTQTTATPSKSEITRQTILSTGRRLVARDGFGAMGLSQLLKEAGVPKGSFYHYFASKEAYGEAILTDYVEDYLARIDTLLARGGQGGEQGADLLMAFCQAWLDQDRSEGLVSTCLVVKLGAEVADLSEPMRAVLDDGVSQLTARIAQMLKIGAKDGSLVLDAPAPDLAGVIYAQLLGAAILSKLSHSQHPLERALDDIKRRVMARGPERKSQ